MLECRKNETMFIRKAPVGFILSIRGECDTQCVVLGDHRICQ